MSSSSTAKGDEADVDYRQIFGVEIVRGPLQLKEALRRVGGADEEEQEDDGLTEAQRAAELAKEKRMIEAIARGVGYKDRVRSFNEKLAKQTEHNEMPRISGQ